jgi:putative ABC transport system substrate-binding protein
MQRRLFACILGCGIVSLLSVRPLAGAKIPRIAFLGLEPTPAPIEAFRQGLRERGYVEGETVTIEWRFSRDPTQYPKFAAEMIHLNVDLIVTGGPPTFATWNATKTIPIVFAGISDPLGAGLVASLAHPGGNITGVPYLGVELNPKRVQLLKEALPPLRTLAVLRQPSPEYFPNYGRYSADWMKALEVAAGSLRISVHVQEIREPSELERAFARMAAERVHALLVINNAIFYSHRQRIAELAMAHRLPTMFDLQQYVEAGGLMSYAPSLVDAFRHIASYVDKILKGAKPADLPVEQPTKFELIINLKTAKALGLTIPQSVLGRADEIIQ